MPGVGKMPLGLLGPAMHRSLRAANANGVRVRRPTIHHAQLDSTPLFPLHQWKPTEKIREVELAPSRRPSMTATSMTQAEKLVSIRRSLLDNQRRTARDLSVAYLNAIPSGSSTAISAQTEAVLDELFNVYLDNLYPADPHSLEALLGEIKNEPRLFTPNLLVRLSKLYLSRPNHYGSCVQQLVVLPPVKNTDVPVVHRLVSALLRQTHLPTPTIAQLLAEEQQRRGKSEADYVKSWDLDIYDEIIRYQEVDEAVLTLAAYRDAVLARKGPEAQNLSFDEVAKLSKPYVRVMMLWTKATLDPKAAYLPSSADIPTKLAADLSELLGQEHHLPTVFLNTWMNAERVAKNYTGALKVWEFLDKDPRPRPGQVPPELRSTTAEPPQADRQSWIIYFKLAKSVGSAPTPAILRAEMRSLLSAHNIAQLDTTLLNGIVSRLTNATVPDLPLLLLVLRLYDWDEEGIFGPPPDSRTINMVAASLVRIWRASDGLLDPLFPPASRGSARHAASCQQRVIEATFSEEWEMVSQACRDLAPVEEAGQSLEDLWPLPLSSKAVSDIKNPSANPVIRAYLRPLMSLVNFAIRIGLSTRLDSDELIDEALDRVMERVYAEAVPPAEVAWVRMDGRWTRVTKEGPDSAGSQSM